MKEKSRIGILFEKNVIKNKATLQRNSIKITEKKHAGRFPFPAFSFILEAQKQNRMLCGQIVSKAEKCKRKVFAQAFFKRLAGFGAEPQTILREAKGRLEKRAQRIFSDFPRKAY